MSKIHFLNVKLGDCSVIKHNSERVTVIDVCNAKPPNVLVEKSIADMAILERGISGNFQQKKYPVNPTSYLKDHDINSIFRYIQTHPDMDHMDGIKTLFDEFSPSNFWDTNNIKEIDDSSWENSPYNEDDWKFYKNLRDTKPDSNPKRLALLAGKTGQYWNIGDDGSSGGDGLHILAPTQGLIDSTNETDHDYNDCSYVILYRTGNNRIIFSGDSHNDTWTHILENYRNDVEDIDLLIAPHHGRDSDRSYEFLDVLKPTLTFFGIASSKDLAYSPWYNRGFSIVTNNQANCMIVDANSTPMVLYVTHKNFASRVYPSTYYDDTFKAWYVGCITEDLIP